MSSKLFTMHCGALLFVLAILVPDGVISVAIPPKITKQSPGDIYYRPGYYVKIECEAFGYPSPDYYWERAGVSYKPEGNDKRVVQMKGFGTLLINSPEDKDEGIYQCFATNSYGTTMTHMFNLRMAKLDPFIIRDEVKYLDAMLGGWVMLECQPPDSVPDPEVTWRWRLNNYHEEIVNVDNRLTIDLYNRLHITMVQEVDVAQGREYFCVVKNTIMQTSVSGPRYRLNVNGKVDATMAQRYPIDEDTKSFVEGQDARLKCIFSGNPIPFIHWQRIGRGGNLPNNAVILSRGQELMIRNIQAEDSGTYECRATQEKVNKVGIVPFKVEVITAPYWIVKPQDVNIFEDGTAEIECTGMGALISIFWFVNGVELKEALQRDSRLDSERFHKIGPNKIVFERLTLEDTMVFQCNISNSHGYIFGEARLNVLAEPPTILTEPEKEKKVAEGRPYTLTCTVTGNPMVTWYKDDMLITGGRFTVMKNGDLYSEKALLTDAGMYRCVALNKWGSTEAQGALIVRRRTLIIQRPIDIEVRKNTNAKFTCSGTTDPEEIDNLTIEWQKDGTKIEHTDTLSPRTFINIQDNSLTISGAEERDTGFFTCVASNGLDNETASARLVVTDVPDQVTDVTVNNTCRAPGVAELHWKPGSFNNAPIQYFTIEFRTSKDLNHWVFAKKVPYTRAMTNVTLEMGLDYSFRVTAYNKNGQSKPSDPSTTKCITLPGSPSRQPANVRTIGDLYQKLHIEWTPVPPEYHGATTGFYYQISILSLGFSDEFRVTIVIDDWRQSSLNVTHGGVPYHPYNITVESKNTANGSATVAAKEIIGYAYEGMPNISPTDLQVSDIQPDNALFTWNFLRREIGKVDTLIKGEFRGFKIQVWQEGKQADTIRNWDFEPDEFPSNETGNTFSARVTGLLPNTRLEARVALLNNFYVSRPSDTVRFVTPPGVPGPVEFMQEFNIGDTHINLQWRTPLDNRGDIIGYDIGYQEVNGLLIGDMVERYPQVDDPYATTAMLSGLKPSTKYRIHMWARTARGRGESFFIERTTRSSLEPLIPRFTISAIGSDFINVTWWSDAYKDSGTVIYVEYMKLNGREWISTTPNVAKNWVAIKPLEAGITYQIRVASTNGETVRLSGIEEVTTDGLADAYDVAANVGWFLGMLFAILLEIALVIVFVVCYRRGFRFKSRDRRPVTTFRDGNETYTDKAEFPRNSSDFGPEPAGFSNDYYADRDDGYDDKKFNDRNDDYRRDDYDYDANGEYRDPNYSEDAERHDYDGQWDERDYGYQQRKGARADGEYEEYGENDDRYADYPARADDYDRYGDRRTGRGNYRSEADDDRAGGRYDSEDYGEDRYRGQYEDDRRARYNDYRTDPEDDRYRYDEYDDRDPRHRRGVDDDRDTRYDSRRDRYDDEYDDDDHHCGNTDPNHDHTKCRSVVREYSQRYSGTGDQDHDIRPSSRHNSRDNLRAENTFV